MDVPRLKVKRTQQKIPSTLERMTSKSLRTAKKRAQMLSKTHLVFKCTFYVYIFIYDVYIAFHLKITLERLTREVDLSQRSPHVAPQDYDDDDPPNLGCNDSLNASHA